MSDPCNDCGSTTYTIRRVTMGDERDNLLATIEEMIADSLQEDEYGRQYVVEAPELLEELLLEFSKARALGVIKYPVPA